MYFLRLPYVGGVSRVLLAACPSSQLSQISETCHRPAHGLTDSDYRDTQIQYLSGLLGTGH